jgi:ABC-type iron transport system FetAB ATPase subunit
MILGMHWYDNMTLPWRHQNHRRIKKEQNTALATTNIQETVVPAKPQFSADVIQLALPGQVQIFFRCCEVARE